MFIEMIDLLRCVNAHEDTWLVASFKDISNRIVLDGTLGCPVCSAQYEITRGIADFTLGRTLPALTHTGDPAQSGDELAMKAGAFLDATQPGATLVLGGSWARAAQELAEMADVRVIAMNAPNDVRESERVGLVRVANRIPLATGSVHGIAFDSSFREAMIEETLRVVRPGGRVVGPASLDPPSEAAVLARDENQWVAEKAAEMISIRRGKAE